MCGGTVRVLFPSAAASWKVRDFETTKPSNTALITGYKLRRQRKSGAHSATPGTRM
jgi:hypothetical protein